MRYEENALVFTPHSTYLQPYTFNSSERPPLLARNEHESIFGDTLQAECSGLSEAPTIRPNHPPSTLILRSRRYRGFDLPPFRLYEIFSRAFIVSKSARQSQSSCVRRCYCLYAMHVRSMPRKIWLIEYSRLCRAVVVVPVLSQVSDAESEAV
jgi:hypothetical protein